MLIVPVQPVPSQIIQVLLGGQQCTLAVYQKRTGMYMNVSVGALIIGGVICENANRIVRSVYLGFIGDFVFLDTQGNNDPVYTGLGSRWVLVYLEASDLPAGVG